MSAHVGERLAAYLDGEIGAAERVLVDAHLAECVVCTTLLEQLTLVDSAVAALTMPETGDDGAFAARVRARIEAEALAPADGRARKPRVGRGLPRWTWAAAAVLLLAVVAPLTLRERRLERAGSDVRAPAVRFAEPPRPAEAQKPEETDRAAPAAAPPFAPEPAGPRRAAAPPQATRPEGASAVQGSHGEETLSAAVTLDEVAVPPQAEARSRAAGLATSLATGGEKERLAKSVAPAAGDMRDASDGEEAGGEATAFARLAARRPTSAHDWRRLREAWRELAPTLADEALADEARVRAVEAAAEAFRASRDERDGRVLERDVAEYLARREAVQAARVRRLLRPEP